ncbi:Fatty acid desaturase [Noviherbaspirillum humi]|uniref:Fatty acid desaturase n=1 Tax=Noviherbaspirillum humi TaxID=1688639 RepID=A0A239L7B1_9BURK|nr:fatty acid desaturase family protein [Noviherbaspirillum humi]SNT25569.1 Fatty acid desaturase [Noviherbaspirillum humi]
MEHGSNRQQEAALGTIGITGEEFRDDDRRASMRRLPAEQLKALTALDDRRSALALAQTLLLTAAILAAAVAWWSPWAALAGVFLIATQQHAMFVLAHEAAHYRLFSNRRLNDLVGRAIGCSAGISMCAYRVIHRLHHNHLYGPQDPDIALHGGYPRGKAYLLKKVATDLAGLTAWKTLKYFFGAPAANAETRQAQRPLDDTSPALRQAALRDRWGVLATQAVLPVAVWAIGGPGALLKYAVLWVLPALTVLQAILRLRAIAEHGAPAGYASPLTAARTNLPGPLLRLLLFPHHVNYHVEHHLFPAVPHYHLPRLHRELRRLGMLDGAEVRYFGDTWKRVYAPRAARPESQAA